MPVCENAFPRPVKQMWTRFVSCWLDLPMSERGCRCRNACHRNNMLGSQRQKLQLQKRRRQRAGCTSLTSSSELALRKSLPTAAWHRRTRPQQRLEGVPRQMQEALVQLRQ